MAVVKLAKPGCGSKLQPAMGAGLGLETPTGECVITGRDYYTGGYLEGREQRFAVRVPIKFEAVACFHSNVDRRHEVFPRFKNPARICYPRVFIFKEFLANPTEVPIFRRTRLVCAAQVRLTCSRPGQKPEQRLETGAVLIHGGPAIKEVVRIVYFETPSSSASRRYVTLSARGPAADEEVLISTEL